MKAYPGIEHVPDDPDNTPATMHGLINVILEADDYWPQRVESAFAKGGFTVRLVEREEPHVSVWVAYLKADSVAMLAPDKKGVTKQLRKLLAKAGLKIRPGELTVLYRRPNGNVKCVFMLGRELPPTDV